MVDVFSRRTPPRSEDSRARQLIERNRQTITRLADQISGGAYSASRRRAAMPSEPEAEGLVVSDLGAGRKAAAEPRPYVRVSPNRRVVVVDLETNRQMHFLGEIRRVDGARRFVLATAGNGFFSPVDPEIASRLEALDGAAMGPERDEDALAREIGDRLGIA
jgi:hypothetical protein